MAYHDHEWGVPLHDDGRLFELLILECFQAGLSWECILNKREAFRVAFEGFNPIQVAQFDEVKTQELLANKAIVRNKLKIQAAITNARTFLDIQQEFGSFDTYLWSWTNGEVVYEVGKTSSSLSDQISKDLKRRGMKFVGTTIIYAYLQAAGVISSHEPSCFLSAK